MKRVEIVFRAQESASGLHLVLELDSGRARLKDRLQELAAHCIKRRFGRLK